MPNSVVIAKNAIRMILAMIGRKGLTMVYFVMIARYAGAYTMGLFFLIVCYALLLGVFINFGLSEVLVREASRDNQKTEDYLGNILGVQGLIAAGVLIFGAVSISFLNYPPITKHFVFMAICLTVLSVYNSSLYSCLRAHYRMKYEAIGIVAGQSITLTVGAIAVLLDLGVYYLVFAVLAYEIFNVFYATSILIKKLHIVPRVRFSRSVVWSFLRMSWPFAISALFIRIQALDAVFLSRFLNEQYVGWYSVPSRITSFFFFIPYALSTAIFPALSNYYLNDVGRIRKMLLQAQDYLMWFVVPVTVGVMIVSPGLIIDVFGKQFEPSILPLQIMMFSLIPMFLYQPIGAMLNACNKQFTNTVNILSSIMIHVVLSLALIQKYNILGVAISAVISNSFLFLRGMFCASRIVSLDYNRYFVDTLKVLLSSSIMAVFIYYLDPRSHVIVTIFVGILVYVLSSTALSGITRSGFLRGEAKRRWSEMSKLFLTRG